MKKLAYTLSLIFLMAPLAGCSGTDAEVKVDLSNEEINDLIDENLEDVMNNTTVVVFQEYHNNTTVINNNQFNNNTTNNVDESGASSSTTTYNYNGTSNADLRMFTVEWDPEEHVEDPSDLQLTRPFYYDDSEGELIEWDYGHDSILGADDAQIDDYDLSTIYVMQYNAQIVEISLTCEFMYILSRVQYESREGYFRDFLANNYGYSSSEIEEAAQNLSNRFQNSPSQYPSYQMSCQSGYTDWITLFEIDLELGTAMEFLSVPDMTVDINCDDGYGTGIGNHVNSHLMGGQANCTISGSTRVYSSIDEFYRYVYDESNDTNILNIGIELGNYYSYVPTSFAVYFELHPVTVHQ